MGPRSRCGRHGVVMPLGNQFWGDRYGQLADPYGHRWSVPTQKEELTREEMEKRARAAGT